MALTDNLAVYYELDEVSGVVAHDSHGGNDAVATVCTLGVAGIIGTGFSLTGLASRIIAGNPTALQFTGNMSLQAWVKTSAAAYGAIISKYTAAQPSYQLDMSAAGKLTFYVWRGAVAKSSGLSSTAINDGLWHHVVGVNDGTNLIVYIDGVVRASAANGGAVDNATASFCMGSDGNFAIIAVLDEIAAWGRDLTLAEVGTLYNAGAGYADLSQAAVNFYPVEADVRDTVLYGLGGTQYEGDLVPSTSSVFGGTILR